MRKDFKDLTGQEFLGGKLKVLEYSHRNKNGRHYYKIQCLWGYEGCSGEFYAEGRNLRYGTTKSCGCKGHHEQARKLSERGDTMHQKAAREKILTNRQSKICERFGEAAKSFYTKAQLLYVNAEYTYCKNAAKTRMLEFSLSYDQFLQLIVDKCHYCGIVPQLPTEYTNVLHVDRTQHHRNGIDRLDSSIGYVTQNCVTACETCNLAKNDMHIDSFLAWIARVYNHQTGLTILK